MTIAHVTAKGFGVGDNEASFKERNLDSKRKS